MVQGNAFGLICYMTDWEKFQRGEMYYDVVHKKLVPHFDMNETEYESYRWLTYDQWYDKDTFVHEQQFTTDDGRIVIAITYYW